MLTIRTMEAWSQAYPGARIGLLEITGVDNSGPVPELEAEKRAVETRLRERYANSTRADLLEMPVMGAYHRYYRKFGYSYHVLLQLESLVHKGKDLPDISPLVDANYAAELETLILTAGHDAAKLQGDLLIDVASEGESFTQMGGVEKSIPAGDMVMRDSAGIICSILRGQDDRSPITRKTSHVLYVSYVPAGLSEAQVQEHLGTIEKYARLFSPGLSLEQSLVLSA